MIPQFDKNKSNFRFAQTYNPELSNEANLLTQIWLEAIFKFGVEVYYLERELNSPEPIFGEFLAAKISKGTQLYLQPENIAMNGGWTNEDMYSKFGLQPSDEETYYCPKATFMQAKNNPEYDGTNNKYLPFYPRVNDLIYHINAKKLFEIKHIEDETTMGYIFGNRNFYQIKCKVYSYDSSEISNDTSIPQEIQALDAHMTINGVSFNIAEQEENNWNVPIENKSSGIIDTTEQDALD